MALVTFVVTEAVWFLITFEVTLLKPPGSGTKDVPVLPKAATAAGGSDKRTAGVSPVCGCATSLSGEAVLRRGVLLQLL